MRPPKSYRRIGAVVCSGASEVKWQQGHPTGDLLGVWFRKLSLRRSPADGTLRGLRQVDGDKQLFWVEIILTGFVNHTNLAVLCTGSIIEDLIDFAQFERRGVVAIGNAYDELCFASCHAKSNIQILHIQRILFNKLAPALDVFAH